MLLEHYTENSPMKILMWTLMGLIVLIGIYLVGPKVQYAPLENPDIAPWSITLDSLDSYVSTKEMGVQYLKPDNQSRLVWLDSIRKTPFSIVYIHGFSASPFESDSTPFQLAKALGCNLYLPLLAGHGLGGTESFAELTPNDLIKSAKEAVAIGQLIGDDVIVMSCSTGGTLSIYLAGANKDMIDALIMYSPNIALADPTAKLITGPWGSKILKLVTGDYWNPEGNSDDYGKKYWTITYKTEGLLALQSLLDQTMKPKIFEDISQPYFIGYYYKDEEHQDHTISTKAIVKFDSQTSTITSQKSVVAFPDAGEHVIANYYKGKNVKAVCDSTLVFASKVLGLPKSN